MIRRKALGRKLRFEVFKRDRFTCQYCGGVAPTVVLVVDHVKPVAKDGSNELLNLITSCEVCNSGKGPRELSDETVLSRQLEQLQDLADRREQIEMMLDWKTMLIGMDCDTARRVAGLWEQMVPTHHINESGLHKLQGWLHESGVEKVLDAMRTSVQQYLKFTGTPPVPTKESAEKSLAYIPRIIAGNEKPWLRGAVYTRTVLRNKYAGVCDESAIIGKIEDAVARGVDIEEIKKMAVRSADYNDWLSWLDDRVMRERRK